MSKRDTADDKSRPECGLIVKNEMKAAQFTATVMPHLYACKSVCKITAAKRKKRSTAIISSERTGSLERYYV